MIKVVNFIKGVIAKVFDTNFLIKVLLVFAILTLAQGHFVVYHYGGIDISTPSYGEINLKVNSSN